MKRFIKHLLLCVASFIALMILGMNTISIQTIVQNKKASYEKTEFAYKISAPSRAQLEELASHTDAIESIFPVYNFNMTLRGKNNSKVNLLLSEHMDKASIGLFNDTLLVSGKFNENLLSLDKTAALALGVIVGDSVNASLGGQSFSFTVGAIYSECTYIGLDKGLAQGKFTTSISEAFGKELVYDIAFIKVTNKDKCALLLKDYYPLGLIMSEEEYIAEQKASGTRPAGLTDEEWTEYLRNNYPDYVEEQLSIPQPDAVQDKEEIMADVDDQTSTSEKRVNAICILVAVAMLILYPLLLILFTFTNRHNDTIRAENGEKDIGRKYNLFIIFSTIITAGLVLFTLAIYGLASQHFAAYVPIMIAFTVPLVASLFIVLPIINRLYIKKRVYTPKKED